MNSAEKTPYCRALVLVLAAAGVACAVGALGQQHAAAVLEAIPQDNIVQGRNALEKWEQQAATESGIMNIILGNTCFTTAIADMKQGCTKMDSTNRCWLAIQFTVCFQRASGFKPLDCPTVCPKYKRLQSCVEGCTSRMDQNTYTTYTQFFSDVFNMCLFLQTQNFQEWTTALVQDMHLQTAAANASLGNIKGQLASQNAALQQSLQALENLQTVQQQTAEAAQAGLEEVRAVGQLSQGLRQSMNKSLELTDALSSHQIKLLQAFDVLEQQQKQQAAQALQAWQQLAADAAALEDRQLRYESLQSKLLNASEGLLSQSQGMSSLMDLLLHYQQAGSTLLSSLHSSSTRLQDIAFYLIALSIPLFFFTHPTESRLLLLLAVLVAWVAEKVTMQHITPLQYAFGGGAVGASSGGRTPAYFHTVKLGVRLGVLGSGASLVLWLLLKRQAARNRKEQIFEELRRSFAAAAALPLGFPMPSPALHAVRGQLYAQPAPAAAAAAPPPPPAAAAAAKAKAGSQARMHAAAAAEAARLSTAAPPVTPVAAAAAAATGCSRAVAALAHTDQQQQHAQQQQQNPAGAWLQNAYHHPHMLLPHFSHLPTGPAAAAPLVAQDMPYPQGVASMHVCRAPSQQLLILPPTSAYPATAAAGTTTLPLAAAAAGNAAASSEINYDMDNEQESESQPPMASALGSCSKRQAKAAAAAAAGGDAAVVGRGKAKAAGAKRGRGKAAAAAAVEINREEEEGREPSNPLVPHGKRPRKRTS